MRYNSEHKARTRLRLLEEAAQVLRTDGPERLGIAKVTRRAGLTHGAFYIHFSSKEELLSEALGFIAEARLTLLDGMIDGATPFEALQRIVDSYLSMDHCNNAATGCPMPILAGEYARFPAADSAKLLVTAEQLTKTIHTLLDKAGGVRPLIVADAIVCEMVGAVALARLASSKRATEILRNARQSVAAKLPIENA